MTRRKHPQGPLRSAPHPPPMSASELKAARLPVRRCPCLGGLVGNVGQTSRLAYLLASRGLVMAWLPRSLRSCARLPGVGATQVATLLPSVKLPSFFPCTTSGSDAFEDFGSPRRACEQLGSVRGQQNRPQARVGAETAAQPPPPPSLWRDQTSPPRADDTVGNLT